VTKIWLKIGCFWPKTTCLEAKMPVKWENVCKKYYTYYHRFSRKFLVFNILKNWIISSNQKSSRLTSILFRYMSRPDLDKLNYFRTAAFGLIRNYSISKHICSRCSKLQKNSPKISKNSKIIENLTRMMTFWTENKIQFVSLPKMIPKVLSPRNFQIFRKLGLKRGDQKWLQKLLPVKIEFLDCYLALWVI
jgi:hypothetical protein